MDPFNSRDIKMEKANAISRYRKIQTITVLFRFVELFVFLIILSSLSSQLTFSFKLSADHFTGFPLAFFISPRFVFILGNAIVIHLFLISRQFSDKNGEKSKDFYEEYVGKYQRNHQYSSKEVQKTTGLYKYKYSVCSNEKSTKIMCRSRSENNLGRRRAAACGEVRGRELRRSMTESCRKSSAAAVAGRSVYVEDDMSGEEFRQTVEAFIARQQKYLKEDEE